MQVYLVSWEGQTGDPEAFRNFSDIEPSIRISYSKATDLKIKCLVRTIGGPLFTASGKMDGTDFTCTFTVKRLSVWDSPTHI